MLDLDGLTKVAELSLVADGAILYYLENLVTAEQIERCSANSRANGCEFMKLACNLRPGFSYLTQFSQELKQHKSGNVVHCKPDLPVNSHCYTQSLMCCIFTTRSNISLLFGHGAGYLNSSPLLTRANSTNILESLKTWKARGNSKIISFSED